MVGAKAGADVCVLFCFRIIIAELAIGLFQWEQLGRRVVRSFLTEGRIVRWPYGGRNPNSALAIEHRIVNIGLTFPRSLVAPIG